MRLEKDNICQDPEYQRQKGVRTYFPPGTVCYSDPSEGIKEKISYHIVLVNYSISL